MKEQTLTGPTYMIVLGGDCQSSSIMYLSGPGVDPTLSASVSFNSLRYMVSVICIGLNLAIVAIGSRNEEILTTIFMGVGVAGSFLSSWWIARMISAVGSISKISLTRFRVLGIGFFSKKLPRGTGASSTPRCIAISTINTKSPNISFVSIAILLSTVAYISLYLGLRSASWWKPLAILGVVGAGACSRAVLIENGKLDDMENSRKSSDFGFLRMRSAFCQHMIEQEPSVSARTNSHSSDHTSDAGRSESLPEQSNKWTIVKPSGHIHAHLALISTDGIHDPQARVLFNAYAVASKLYSLNLEPRSHGAEEMIISDGIYVQSEFLGKDAIWQQRLNLAIPRIESETDGQQPSLTYRNVAALLRIWVTEALNGTRRCFVASKLSQISSDGVYKVPHTTTDALLLRYSNDHDDNEIQDLQCKVRREYAKSLQTRRPLKNEWIEIWSNKVMLWMAVKILFALKPVALSYHDFGGQIQSEFREMVSSYTRFFPGIGTSSLIEPKVSKRVEDLVPWYISRLSAAQLIKPRNDRMTVGRFRVLCTEET